MPELLGMAPTDAVPAAGGEVSSALPLVLGPLTGGRDAGLHGLLDS
ncbi:hypothetical protein [Streptomyces sp. NPDC085479]